MNTIKIDKVKVMIKDCQYNILTTLPKLILNCYNENVIVLNNFINKLDIILNDDSKLDLYIKDNSKTINCDINIIINNNAVFNLYGSFKSYNDNNIKIINNIKGNNNRSNIILRGIAYRKSILVDVSLIVNKNTIGNILTEDIKGLNNGGEIIVKPIMKIKTNEVIANHYVTISNPDQNMLFYLQTKGLSFKKAKQLILKGFLKSIMVMKNE